MKAKSEVCEGRYKYLLRKLMQEELTYLEFDCIYIVEEEIIQGRVLH